ncbi:MAG: V-type ATP synthase subunit F [Clostridiales bacterium]|jgi:V/A-type H+-transporting ATPase subunit F|nr:V-type ATP synthase subunit F [Clostridiales bacterium]
MYKIAVMGDRDSVYGFASVGLDIFPTEENASAERELRALAEGGYAIIYMTEKLYHYLDSALTEYSGAKLPAIIPIPGVSGNTGLGMAQAKKNVVRAIGSDILL